MSDLFVMDNSTVDYVPVKLLTDDAGKPIENLGYHMPFESTHGLLEYGEANTLNLYTRDNSGNFVPAADQSLLKYYLVPADFDLNSWMADAINGSQDHLSEAAFWEEGDGNIQKHQQTVAGNESQFTLAFTDTNSYLLGLVEAAASDLSLPRDAGIFNYLQSLDGGSPQGTDGAYRQSLRNAISEENGEYSLFADNYHALGRYLIKNVKIDYLSANLLDRTPEHDLVIGPPVSGYGGRGSTPIQVLDTAATLQENTSASLDVLPGSPGAVATGTLATDPVEAPMAVNGTVAIVDGALSYTPDQDFVGQDYVTFVTTGDTGKVRWDIPVDVTGFAHTSITSGPNGSTVTETFDSAGAPVNSRTDRPDGSYDLTGYAATAAGTRFASSVRSYSATGTLLGTTELDHNGSVVSTSTPSIDADGSQVVSTYDAYGTLTGRQTTRTDGTKEVLSTVDGPNPFFTYSDDAEYGSDGLLDAETFTRSDGFVYQTGQVADGPDGSRTETIKGPGGAVLSTVATASDGSREVAAFGVQGEPWASTSSEYDAAGDLVSKALLLGDGSTLAQGSATPDGSGNVSIAYASAAGGAAGTEVDSADGSSTISISGIVGQDYVGETSAFDDAGNIASRSFAYADGSQETDRYQLDYSTGSPYEASAGHYDPSGLLLGETDYLPDGSSYGTRSSTRGTDGSVTTTSLDADGNLTLTEVVDGAVTTDTYHYGAIQSVNVTVGDGGSYSSSDDGSYVVLDDDASATLSGANVGAAIQGRRASVTLTGTGANAFVSGIQASVTVSGGSVSFDTASVGSVTGDGDAVSLNGHAIATVSGEGNSAYLASTGNVLSIGSASVTVSDYADGTVGGDADTITLGTGSALTLYGSNDSVVLDGTGSSATLGPSSVEQDAAGDLTLRGFADDSAVSVTSGGVTIGFGNGDVVSSSDVPGKIDGFDSAGLERWSRSYDASGSVAASERYIYTGHSLAEVDAYDGSGTLARSDLYSPTRNVEVGSYLYAASGQVGEVVDLTNNLDWLLGSDGIYTERRTGATSSTRPTLDNS